MVAFVKLNGFVEHMAEGVHNLGSDQLAVALSNTAPGSEGTPPTGSTAACILANVTQIAYTYASGRAITTSSSSQTAGTYALVLTDLTLSATGGSVGPFRYIYLYNDTAASDNLIGYWDLGSSDTITNGTARLLDFSATTIAVA
jgi:hypothetical protein